jgi:hypothetical protein
MKCDSQIRGLEGDAFYFFIKNSGLASTFWYFNLGVVRKLILNKQPLQFLA